MWGAARARGTGTLGPVISLCFCFKLVAQQLAGPSSAAAKQVGTPPGAALPAIARHRPASRLPAKLQARGRLQARTLCAGRHGRRPAGKGLLGRCGADHAQGSGLQQLAPRHPHGRPTCCPRGLQGSQAAMQAAMAEHAEPREGEPGWPRSARHAPAPAPAETQDVAALSEELSKSAQVRWRGAGQVHGRGRGRACTRRALPAAVLRQHGRALPRDGARTAVARWLPAASQRRMHAHMRARRCRRSMSRIHHCAWLRGCGSGRRRPSPHRPVA